MQGLRRQATPFSGNIEPQTLMGVLTGIVVTMLLLQSSSSTTVMVVGFANAGLINLAQAVSVIIGANIGTTVTAKLSPSIFMRTGLSGHWYWVLSKF